MTKNASQSVGHGWKVVEKYISGQKGLEKKDVIQGERGEGRGERYSYEKADTVPVVVVDGEKKKVRKELAIPASTPSSIVYNLIGDSSRVNINSQDISVNVKNITSSDLFEELKKAIEENEDNVEKKVHAFESGR